MITSTAEFRVSLSRKWWEGWRIFSRDLVERPEVIIFEDRINFPSKFLMAPRFFMSCKKCLAVSWNANAVRTSKWCGYWKKARRFSTPHCCDKAVTLRIEKINFPLWIRGNNASRIWSSDYDYCVKYRFWTKYSMFVSCMLTRAIKSVNHKLEVVCLHFHVLFHVLKFNNFVKQHW